MRTNTHYLSGVIILASVAVVIWLASSHSDAFTHAVEGISVVGLTALVMTHFIYISLNAEIWYKSMKEAEPEITRFAVYSSYGSSSFFWPMSALFGAGAQIWALKRIAPESHVGHAISSLAPVIWVKGMIAAVCIAALFGHSSTVNAAAAVGVLVLIGVALVLAERFTRDKDFFHGLAVIRKPRKMLFIGCLVSFTFISQTVRLAVALKASGISTDIFPVIAVVIGQGFAGFMPIIAGTGSAAVAFSSDQVDAAGAVLLCTGTAFVAGAIVSLSSVIWRRKCSQA